MAIESLWGLVMPMSRMRITVNRMMIAVAIVAMLLGIDRQYRRFEYYRFHAGWCASRARGTGKMRSMYLQLAKMDEWASFDGKSSHYYKKIDFCDKVINHNESMRSKYERAAWRFWETVAPDPPEPPPPER